MAEKTVYILGAGFSKSAGAPLQSEIIKDIYSIIGNDLIHSQYKNLFFEYRKELSIFLSEIFFIESDYFADFSLEDIYTPIDKCIIDNISLRRMGKRELIDIRQKINALISMLIDYKLRRVNKPHIQKFAKYLIDKKRETFNVDKDSDPFSVISTNWDIIIENALKRQIWFGEEGDIDYCFYVHAYSKDEFSRKLRSGLYWRGEGRYNVKVLKLHGSMNWLQCQRCQRVFITFFSKIALQEFLRKPKCVYCESNFGQENSRDNAAYLTSVIVMPTFLKDLNNFQLKLSWQIAGIELQEASKIVFMGYSFPMADFEFRQLLARSVRHDASIDVVLHGNDAPIQFGGIHKINDFLPEKRYRTFFGKREINFFYDGVEEYINSNFS